MVTARLRLLETTDLHMHLLGYDYLSDGPALNQGLTQLVPLIEEARAEVATTLLFDNGDFLQGTPLADHLARQSAPGGPSPIAHAFNTLAYDAITLGNHEFDYGLPYLTSVLAGCDMPVVCSNVRTTPTRNYVAPWTVLTRDVTGSDGQSYPLKIGVIGFVTPQVVDWNSHALNGAIQTDDIIAAARSHLPALHRAGADVVVALCHAGISDAPRSASTENAALHLASLPGIDVVFAGHTHDRFPGPDFAGLAETDIENATLCGKPAVMAGAYGRALGVVDLDLTLDPDGWHIAGHHVELRNPDPKRVAPESAAQTAISRYVADDQSKVLAHLRTDICQTPRRLTSYFAAIGQDDTAPLLAAAQVAAITQALSGTDYADLPVLATTSPYRAGGHGGPGNYIDIPPGPLTRRDITAIIPFDNPMCGVLRRGWQIRNWLEQASRYYRVLARDAADRSMIDPQVPAYYFDQFHGLRYRMDLTVPPRLDDNPARPTRVRDITYDGKPLADDALFLVATTSYRAHGGGGLTVIPGQDIVYTSDLGLPQILINYLVANGVPATGPAPNLGFAASLQTPARFATAASARTITPPPPGVTLAPDAPLSPGFIGMDLTS